MDKTIVGNNAGKVWCALKEIGEISIPELARRLNLSVEKLISNKNELIQKWAIEEKSKIERNQEREKEMLGHFFKKQDYSILENN